MNQNSSVRKLVHCGVVAAIYVVLCLALQPLSYGAVQVRVAEALCLLPVFGAEYIVGVVLGCFLANLLLYSELLMEETMPASAKANVEALYKQSEKLRFLIDSLVKLSRLENGIISLSPQPAALQPLLESVVEQYTAKASEKGLSLQMQDTDAFAVFDFKWTAEALANIVDNAIKYTEHGTITISAVSYEMFARIDISDTGSGIPESEQAKIFARFYRSNSVQKQEGVGIGLYLARQIISGEGGYIKVASVPGKGSTFSIFLPK